MRRWGIRILLCLLLGVVLNVAVAWGCAVFLYDKTDGWSVLDSAAAYVDDNQIWSVGRLERRGLLRIECWVGEPVEDLTYEGRPATLIEKWSRVPAGEERSGWRECATGFPARCLWYRINFGSSWFGSRIQPGDSIEHGWFVNQRSRLHQQVFPLNPIWSSFAINTVFYTAILFALFLGLERVGRYSSRWYGRRRVLGIAGIVAAVALVIASLPLLRLASNLAFIGIYLPNRAEWLWVAALAALAILCWIGSIPLFIHSHDLLKKRSDRCANCGYDLRGAPHAKCPECGAAASN